VSKGRCNYPFPRSPSRRSRRVQAGDIAVKDILYGDSLPVHHDQRLQRKAHLQHFQGIDFGIFVVSGDQSGENARRVRHGANVITVARIAVAIRQRSKACRMPVGTALSGHLAFNLPVATDLPAWVGHRAWSATPT
jgi:hypothetical protein